MARPPRPQFAGAHYHLVNRGNDRAMIFLDDVDREQFLTILERVRFELDWRLLAYCLMPNHYHLFLETPGPSLARGMRTLNGRYAQYFNRRYPHVGHVFQGRYRSVVVARQGYYLELIRYIVLNPVRGGLCEAPENWRWSSHRTTLGLCKSIPEVQVSRVIGLFGATGQYRSFITRGAFTGPADPEFVRDVLHG